MSYTPPMMIPTRSLYAAGGVGTVAIGNSISICNDIVLGITEIAALIAGAAVAIIVVALIALTPVAFVEIFFPFPRVPFEAYLHVD